MNADMSLVELVKYPPRV